MFRQYFFKKIVFGSIYVSARAMKPVAPADPTVPWGCEICIVLPMISQKQQQQHFAVLTRPSQEQQEKEMALKKKPGKMFINSNPLHMNKYI